VAQRGTKPNLTVEERIRIHLFDLSKHREEFVVPLESTQGGVAEATGVLRPNVSRTFKELISRGWVKQRLAHVKDQPRRKKVYFLTRNGEGATRELRKRLMALTISERVGGEVRDTTVGRVMDREGTSLLEVYDRLDGSGMIRPREPGSSSASVLYDRIANEIRDLPPSPEAEAVHSSARDAFLNSGDVLMAAQAINNLGVLHRRAGQRDRARGCYDEALRLLEEAGERRAASLVRFNLGRMEEEGGNRRAAREHFRKVLKVIKQTGGPNEFNAVKRALERVR